MGQIKSLEALPSYKTPPIKEVVCGMRFTPPDKMFFPHIGLFWSKFREEYPRIQHVAPIANEHGGILLDSQVGTPLPRIWFINKENDQVIQFQFDRFYFNWRYRQNAYPRYQYIMEQFEKVHNNLLAFFHENQFGNIQPQEYELTYVNHIPMGTVWGKAGELLNVFNDFLWNIKSDRFLPTPNFLNWNTEFVLPNNNGLLKVSMKNATRIEDKIPVLLFELKAVSLNNPEIEKNIREWFDLAHKWIVKGFTDLTAPFAHEYWKREI